MGGRDVHRRAVERVGAVGLLDVVGALGGQLVAEARALGVAQGGAGDAFAGGVGLGEQVVFAGRHEVRGHVLAIELLQHQGFELQLRSQGLLEVQSQLGLGHILAITEQLEAHGRDQMVVLVVLVVLQVEEGVDPEPAAPERLFVRRRGDRQQAAGAGVQLGADQHVAVRIGAHAHAVADAVVAEHAGDHRGVGRAAA